MSKQELLQKNQPDRVADNSNTDNLESKQEKGPGSSSPASLESSGFLNLNSGELDALLRTAEEVVKEAQMSEEEIDKKLDERQRALDRIKDIDLLKTERLKQLENYELASLTVEDYDRLVEEEIIGPDYAEKLKKIDVLIKELELLKNPTVREEMTLEELKQLRSSCRQYLQNQIEEREQEIINQIEKEKNEIIKYYQDKIIQLEKIVAEVEANPRALERLRSMAEKEMRAHEERIKQEEEKKLKEITSFVQSLSARQENALNRLSEVIENNNLKNDLLLAFEEEDERKKQGFFDKIRNQAIKAVVEGKGKRQIKQAKEVVPWQTKTSINYYYALNRLLSRDVKGFLKAKQAAGDEQAQNLSKQIEQIIMLNSAFYRLFGKKFIKDKKTGKKRLSAFWQAFETRKNNDKKDLIETQKKERQLEAKEAEEFKEKAKEIIKKGGFIIKVPVFKKINGERRQIGARQGAVRLKRIKTKWGKDCWQVAEVWGAAKKVLKVGATSSLDMAFFPSSVKAAAEHYFIKGENGNFIERISSAAKSKETDQEK